MNLTFDGAHVAKFIHLLGIALWFGSSASVGLLSARFKRETDWNGRLAIQRAIASIEMKGVLAGLALSVIGGLWMLHHVLQQPGRELGKEAWLHAKLTFVFIAAVAAVVGIVLHRGGLRRSVEEGAAATPATTEHDEAFFRAKKGWMFTQIAMALGLGGALFFVIFGR